MVITPALPADASAGIAAPRAIQLNGERAERGFGRDVLHDVLKGAGMPLRLTSLTGDDAVGLAWWSPSVGLWLAIDRVAEADADQSFEVTLQVGEGPAARVGRIDIDETGSGRIVSAWSGAYPAAGTPVTLTVSRLRFPQWRPPVAVVTATTPMRAPY